MRWLVVALGVACTLGTWTAAAAAQGPRCLASDGMFAWNCAGPIPGMMCTQILETADPDTWSDNYFCAARDLGLRWSSAGPIAGMRCTQIVETADPHTWADNYLCVPASTPYVLVWSSAGPLPGMACVQWSEPADPHTWADNFLCYAAYGVTMTPPVYGR
jgi:hypothetical protein